MYVGAAYYPEHWPRERWATDARLMREAHINVVRMAEFAWVKMEPVEGSYDFAWLDEAIEVLAKEGIRTILGTPSEAMPAWLARKYPEAVATDRAGRKIPYGARRDSCPTSASYRLLSVRMAEAMAEHYADHPSVIGWQIDNEFSGPYCYCTSCLAAWHERLQAKYKTVEELNRRWGTIFWSHTYASFDEVPLPQREHGNPSLELEHRRFHSNCIVQFQKEQVDVIRRIAPKQFITHNLCGVFLEEIDYYDLAADLDFASLEYYYNNSPWGNHFRVAAYEAGAMDLMRSVKKKNFWITETPSGPIGSTYFLRNLRPLEMRRMNYQAIAHGADGLLWFRWRTCLYGQEQFTHGILGHDGVPGRRYQDVATVAGEFARIAPEIEGTTVRSDVAILYTYDNRWAMRIQPNARDFDYVEHILQYHRAFKRHGMNVDFVNMSESLDGYKVLVLPAAYVMTPEYAEKVEKFVERGGMLLATTRSAVKDLDNIPHVQTLPGLLSKVTGIMIPEYEALLEPAPIRFEEGGAAAQARCLADWITPQSATVVARYTEPHLATYAAITLNQFGRGSAWYVGTLLVDDATVVSIIGDVLSRAGLAAPVAIPAGVDSSIRQRGPDRYLFLMNHNDDAVGFDLNKLPKCKEIISDQAVTGNWSLPAGEVAVLHWQAASA